MAKARKQNSGCLTIFLNLLGIGRSKPRSEHPYRLRDHFLTDNELEFYNALKLAVGERAVIQAQIGLWAIFDVPKKYEAFATARNHIDRKSVDFLLCDPDSMLPIVAIELDDRSHERKDRQERDAVVDAVFQEAGLPLEHVRAQREYDSDQVADRLAPYLPSVQGKVNPQPSVMQKTVPNVISDGPPSCPKCGSTMTIRVATTGQNKGKAYYVCSKRPACKGYVPVEK